MADPNLSDFNGRLKRIRHAHAQGRGFEATGTLGSRSFNRHRSRKTPILRPLLVVALAVVGLKAVHYARVGPQTYQQQIVQMQGGTGLDQLGAFLMQADPLTLYLAAKVKPYLS